MMLHSLYRYYKFTSIKKLDVTFMLSISLFWIISKSIIGPIACSYYVWCRGIWIFKLVRVVKFTHTLYLLMACYYVYNLWWISLHAPEALLNVNILSISAIFNSYFYGLLYKVNDVYMYSSSYKSTIFPVPVISTALKSHWNPKISRNDLKLLDMGMVSYGSFGNQWYM